MNRRIYHFLKNTHGATAIEYALIALIISVGIVAGATAAGTSTSAVFDTLDKEFRMIFS